VIFENSRQEGIVYHMAGVGACQLDNFLRSKYFLLQTISLKPDLIIFSLGANESVSPGFDTLTYQEKYIDLIKRLKQEMPGVSIILTTPPDLLYKKKLPYMKKPIRRAIIRISEETNSAVWDLGELMGGDYSNHIWHLSKYAGPDRIHFSPKGYDFQGLLFTEALMKAYNNYSFLPIQNSNVTNDLKPYRKSLNDHYVQVLHKSNKPIIENNHVENHTTSNALAVKPKRKIHVVSHNETIYSISRKYHLDFKLILRLNGLKESSIIRPGQKIKLR
jgi:LysM repeat protein